MSAGPDAAAGPAEGFEPLGRDADGHPWSARYGDVYASRAGAAAQARAVYLDGCGLLQAPRAWAGRRQFVVLETGFGLGTNFLTTWAQWRADPDRPRVLHYVGVELHPLSPADLVAACADPELLPLAQELAAAWPAPARGLHPLLLDGGRVRLTLAVGDARELLRDLDLGADAIYLDGFAPSRNPEMWDPALLKAVAHLARPGARLASYTVARAVCDGLEQAGFTVRKLPGFAAKAQRLQAEWAPTVRRRRREPRAALGLEAERRALVIGAGIAGAATARALALRGWQVEVLDAVGPAAGASGLPAGLAHVRDSADDDRLARLSRCGLAWLRASVAPGLWDGAGVFVTDPQTRRRARAGLPWPADLAQPAPGGAEADADARAGVRLELPGWWSVGGVAAAASLVAHWLETPGVRLHAGARVLRLDRDAEGDAGGPIDGLDRRDGPGAIDRANDIPARRGLGQWVAVDASGAELARAPVCVLANALDAPRLLRDSGLGGDALPARAQSGQGFLLAADEVPALAGLRGGVMAGCYALPLPEAAAAAAGLDTRRRWLFVGATYEDDPEQPLPPEAVWAHVAGGLGPMVGALPAAPPASARRFAGVRAVAPDRLPAIGAWPDWSALDALGGRIDHRPASEWPHQPGLYVCAELGSRGLTLGALAGECIAAAAEGEPSPLPRALAAAVDPARFALRRRRTAPG